MSRKKREKKPVQGSAGHASAPDITNGHKVGIGWIWLLVPIIAGQLLISCGESVTGDYHFFVGHAIALGFSALLVVIARKNVRSHFEGLAAARTSVPDPLSYRDGFQSVWNLQWAYEDEPYKPISPNYLFAPDAEEPVSPPGFPDLPPIDHTRNSNEARSS